MYRKTSDAKKREILPSTNIGSAFDNYTKSGVWPKSKTKAQRNKTHKQGIEKSRDKLVKKRLKQIGKI